MNIGLLECDHVDERFRPIAGGYREMFEALLRPHLPGLRFTYFDVCHAQLPKAADECDGYLCSGSRFSVYEQLDWIEALKSFLRTLHHGDRKLVGICFGHQAIAAALGGEVTRAPQGWGIGVQAMNLVRQEPWMQPPRATCRLQHMHADQVFQLPPDAVLLGSGEHCEVSMFRVGESLLGIEGHPEFPAAYSEALIRDRAARIGEQTAQAGLASVNRPTDASVVAQWIVRFLNPA